MFERWRAQYHEVLQVNGDGRSTSIQGWTYGLSHRTSDDHDLGAKECRPDASAQLQAHKILEHAYAGRTTKKARQIT